jgi:hypothetical protein
MNNELTVQQLAALAMEAEITDPIDWGELSIKEQAAYEMMAASVVEQLDGLPESQRPIVAMATITKLLVENFVLNIKLKKSSETISKLSKINK